MKSHSLFRSLNKLFRRIVKAVLRPRRAYHHAERLAMRHILGLDGDRSSTPAIVRKFSTTRPGQLVKRVLQWRYEKPMRELHKLGTVTPLVLAPVKGRVVHVCGSLAPGGAERQVANTLRHLSERNLESVHLLCDHLTPNTPEHFDFYLPLLSDAPVQVREIGKQTYDGIPELEQLKRSFFSGYAHDVSALIEEFRELRPEIVHTWLDWSNVRAGLAAVLAGVPKVVLSGRNLNPSHYALYQDYMLPAYQAMLKRQNVILINNSYAGARDYAKWLHMPPEGIRVVYNGVRFPETCDQPAKRQEVRAQLQIPQSATVVGGIFRLNEEKRPLLWVRTAGEAVKEREDLYFVVFGTGPLKQQMMNLAKELGISDRIRHVDLIEDTQKAFALMDACLLTSRGEGTPNVILEAQCYGVPVIVSDVGGCREAVLENQTGHLLKSDSPSDVAKVVLNVLCDEALLETTRALGPKFVSDRFGLERMIEETLQLYEYD